MLQNNNQRLNIWLAQQNQFSYKEFAIKCIEQNITPLSISEFTQKVGMISVGISEYPELTTEEAYKKVAERMNVEFKTMEANHMGNKNVEKSGCSNCNKQISDGGKVV